MSDLILNKNYVFLDHGQWKIVFGGEVMKVVFENKEAAEQNLNELTLLDSNLNNGITGTKEVLLG